MRNVALLTTLVAALGLPMAAVAQDHTDRRDAPQARDCLDGQRQTRGLEAISEREAIVTIVPNRSYRIALAEDCPALLEAEGASFSNGPSRFLGRRNGQPIWANELRSGGRICGGGADRLMLRDRFYDFDRPMRGCRIASVERLP